VSGPNSAQIRKRASLKLCADDVFPVLDDFKQGETVQPAQLRHPNRGPASYRASIQRMCWFGLSTPLVQPEPGQADNHGAGYVVGLQRHPYKGTLQKAVSIAPQFSRIFPTFPRSLARCLSRALRHGAALLFRLSENLFGKAPHRTRTKRFSEPSENAPLGLGSGALSRRFAQECPEGNPGKYKQEK